MNVVRSHLRSWASSTQHYGEHVCGIHTVEMELGAGLSVVSTSFSLTISGSCPPSEPSPYLRTLSPWVQQHGAEDLPYVLEA